MHNDLAARYAEPVPRTPGVLVADDEPGIRNVVEIALRRAGFAVWLAADGQQAVELFRSNQEAIDAALLDVNMPRLDGPQALAAIQEIAPQIPCCFMSGGLGAHTADDLSRQGALGFLRKPFTLGSVIRTVRSLIGDGASTASAAVRRRDMVTSQSEQLDARGTDNFRTAGRSGIGNTPDARGP